MPGGKQKKIYDLAIDDLRFYCYPKVLRINSKSVNSKSKIDDLQCTIYDFYHRQMVPRNFGGKSVNSKSKIDDLAIYDVRFKSIPIFGDKW